jgi:clan AA aspartic protease
VITGTISQRRAYVNLTLRGLNGPEGEVEFVLDTGFTGSLTLPPAACAALALSYIRPQPANLADGTRVILRVYEAILAWDGAERAVEVLGLEGAPLLGMTLLNGCDVHLQVAEGGSVTIERL